MNPKIKAAVLVASQAAGAFGLPAKIREARRDGDRLALLDAVVTALGIITGTALAVRTLRQEEVEK